MLDLNYEVFKPEHAESLGLEAKEWNAEGMTLLDGDKVLAFCCIVKVFDLPVVVFNIIDQKSRSPLLFAQVMARSIKAGFDEYKKTNKFLYVVRDMREKSSEPWLRRLEFRPVPAHEKTAALRLIERFAGGVGEVWVWGK
jgi:hypothetical protein